MYQTDDWQELADGRYYVKRSLYEMQWKFQSPAARPENDMQNFKFCVCPFGGPIACIPDERAHDLQEQQRFMYFYTSSGVQLAKNQWRQKGLVKAGWTSSEDFVCIFRSGEVHMYDILGCPKRGSPFRIFPSEFAEDEVSDACFCGNGFVVRTTCDHRRLAIWAVNDIDNPEPMQFRSTPPVQRPPASMAVISPAWSRCNTLEVLLSTADGSIIVVDEHGAQDQEITTGPFEKMAVSPDGSQLAGYNSQGVVIIMSTDFRENKLKCDMKMSHAPVDMQWCGNDAIMLYWDRALGKGGNHTVVVLGPLGRFIKYTDFGSNIVLSPEIDGARIFSASSCDYLEPVPQCIEDIFNLGSAQDACHLYDAFEAFEEGRADSDDYMQEIQNMDKAVNDCCDAATFIFDKDMQTKLLRASAHGKLFCRGYDHDNFVQICKYMRCINALREKDVGIALTYRQFTLISPEVIINRLVNRRHHLLAKSICQYLNLRLAGVLEHWAICKIEDSEDSVSAEQLLHTILTNLREYKTVSYASIARNSAMSRQELAIDLLDYEPRASESVTCLLEFQEYSKALVQALKSYDTDLVYQVLHQIVVDQLSENDRFRIISSRNNSVASDVFLSYCKDENRYEMITHFLKMCNKRNEAGNLSLESAFENFIMGRSDEAEEDLQRAAEAFDGDKMYQFENSVVKEQLQLYQIQGAKAPSILGESVTDTILYFLRNDLHQKAEEFQKVFHVPAKRFYLLQLRVFAENYQWGNFEKVGMTCGNSVGWHALCDLCLERDEPDEAVKYILKLSDYATKMEMLSQLQMWKPAAALARQENDMQGLSFIHKKCGDPRLQAEIAKILSS